jgi:hypothetical protein
VTPLYDINTSCVTVFSRTITIAMKLFLLFAVVLVLAVVHVNGK